MRAAKFTGLARTENMTEYQAIALGFRPRTWRGWLFWLRYWSPLAFAWQRWRRP